MTVVKARDIQKDGNGIVFNFRDIAAEGQAMLEAARAESKRIITEAKAQTTKNQEKIYKEAEARGLELGRTKGYEEAFGPAQEKGYKEGYEKALADIKVKFEQHIAEPLSDLKKTIEYFENEKKQLIWQAEQSFVVLAVKLAEKVIRREIELCPELVCRTVRSALETVAHTTDVVVRVSPQDISVIEELKGSLSDILGRFESVNITADETVSSGGCIVQTERGKVDARIENQLARIARDILEPGAVLEIAEPEQENKIDKLIRETSTEVPVTTDDTEEEIVVLEQSPADNVTESDNELPADPAVEPKDQAAKLRDQIRGSRDGKLDQDSEL